VIEPALGRLLNHALHTGLTAAEDVAYARNRVLEVLRIEDYDLVAESRDDPGGPLVGTPGNIDDLLRPLLEDAVVRGLITPDTVTQRDLWDSAVMGCFVQRPSAIARHFWDTYAVEPAAATGWYHQQAVASNYIRASRTDQNVSWRQPTAYGEMDLTINVSKPEKDPRDIIAAAREQAAGYPQCLLCRENEGYAGRADHPARQNLRLIPMDLLRERWYLQYSPYRYYNEHCIVLSDEHRPMRIDRHTFERLAAFTGMFPHYLIGSNADLPIVGGSILSHDHFQGGRFEFAMDRARRLRTEERGDLEISILHWPLAVIRLSGPDDAVIGMATDILVAWREHSDPDFNIQAFTDEVPHNTITPIARRTEGRLRLDLVLRNNRTTPAHPDGLFHPHAQIHPIKKENIGLIEVMGLAVLPGRLEHEFEAVAHALSEGGDLSGDLAGHGPMLEELRSEGGPDADPLTLTRHAAGAYFVRGLEHCGVFGDDPVTGIGRFLEMLH
jgi:UDPglucose--hexose-1-phosphate uridylyltransferase